MTRKLKLKSLNCPVIFLKAAFAYEVNAVQFPGLPENSHLYVLLDFANNIRKMEPKVIVKPPLASVLEKQHLY